MKMQRNAIAREQLKKVRIHHLQQQSGTGCMYHSFAALSGDDSLLIHAKDNSPHRFLLRVQEKGYLLWTLYANRFEGAQLAFWKKLSSDCSSEEQVKLIVTIKVNTDQHTVAIEADFKNNKFTVCDPMKPDCQHFNLDGLINSKYGRPIEILCLDSGLLADYKEISPLF
jgi:hypothetical protein